MLTTAEENGIIPLFLLSQNTQTLPLDGSFFNPFKIVYMPETKTSILSNKEKRINQSVATTPFNALSGFTSCTICPFNLAGIS